MRGRYNLRFRRLLLVAGVIGPLATILLTILDTFISPWFTWTGNALSDLGVHPYSYLFNYSLIFEAIMNCLFVLGLKPYFNLRNGTAAGLIISGISLGFVGIFVETYHLYHLTFALIYFILFPVSIILFSREVRRKHPVQSRIGYAVSIISLVDIVMGILLGFNAFKGISLGLAIPEMVEATLLGGWSIYIASWTLRLSSGKNRD